MNAEDIKYSLNVAFNNFDYRLYNVYVFGNESDFLAVSKSGYVWEIEIKISRADYYNDFKKTVDFNCNLKKHDYFQSDKIRKPNKFCFAVPEGLISKDEVPEYAGLIYVTEKLRMAQIIKQPKFLHKGKLFEDKFFLKQMLNKFYYRHMELERRLELPSYKTCYQKAIKF